MTELIPSGRFPSVIWQRHKKAPVSYWLLLINSLANRQERDTAAAMAIWSQFNAKYESDVVFFQRGEEPLFSYADDFFQPEELPALYLSNSPDFLDYITFSREALREAHRKKSLDDLFNDFHQLLKRGLTVQDIKSRLQKKKVLKFLSYAWDQTREAVISIAAKTVESTIKGP